MAQATPALTEDKVTGVINAADLDVVPYIQYTTYTYITTTFVDGKTNVTSNFKTVTNVITDAFVEPTTPEPYTVCFTTQTYWTTFVFGTNTAISSQEKTLSNIGTCTAAV